MTRKVPRSFAAAPSIGIEGVTRAFAAATALRAVDIDLPGGAFCVLLGPSGCGKSTLLRLIAGLDRPTSGTIRIGGRDVTALPPVARDLSMVFQSYALFPHLSVADNILFGLAVRRVPKAERAERLDRVAEMMGLDALLARKPAELSGGQQQRVALARAVISERPICLMDEPLSNLDAKLRAEMRLELRAIQRRLGLTVVYVTHDQIEAMTMADRIVVMNEGRVQQVGGPEEVYARPATVFTARFIGTPPMNVVAAAELAGAGDLLPAGVGPGVLVGLRPEDLAPAEDGLPVRLLAAEYLGADRVLTVAAGDARLLVRLPASADVGGESLRLAWPARAVHLFDAATGARRADLPSFPPRAIPAGAAVTTA